jgi:hypothetical protein
MQVVLTVDTEASIAGAYDDPQANRPLIDEPVWGEVAGRSEALGFIIRTLSAHGLTATFFVETAHVAYFSDRPMGHYVAALLEAGQDVQLHLHPTWCNFRTRLIAEATRVSDHCHRIGEELLVRLLREGIDQIEAWTGCRPFGFRAGNFSTDRSIFVAMRHVGLRYGSNICAAFPATHDPALRLPGGIHDIDGIVELPVTCFADAGPVGRGRLRPLQVTACSFTEIRALLNQLHTAGGKIAVIVTHPFEYLIRDDFRYTKLRPNRMVQGRLEKLCAFLAENSDHFDTVPLEVAAHSVAAGGPAPALVGSPILSTLRAAQNVINDRIR